MIFFKFKRLNPWLQRHMGSTIGTLNPRVLAGTMLWSRYFDMTLNPSFLSPMAAASILGRFLVGT